MASLRPGSWPLSGRTGGRSFLRPIWKASFRQSVRSAGRDSEKPISGSGFVLNRAARKRPAENKTGIFVEKFAQINQPCQMCGAFRAGELTDKAHRPDSEFILRLAHFMEEDWRACCAFLLYVAMQERFRVIKTQHNIFNPESIHNARQRAAERFPELAETLGLK
jgi:hypothetical protein